MITKQDVQNALNAWHVARESAALEHEAFGVILKNQNSLLASLRANGVPFSVAQSDVEKYTKSHNETLLAAIKAMDARCKDYYDMAAKFEASHGHKS